MRGWIRNRLGGEAPDTVEDNARLGRFWMRGELPVMAWDDIPVSSEFLWLHNDRPEQVCGPYKDASISYKTNAHGFRSREIDLASTQRKIMFVGCSFTMGVGVPYDDVWTSVATRAIAESLGEPVEQHNFGYSGHGNDFFAMIVHQVLPVLKPDLLVVLFTEFARRTHYHRFGRLKTLLPGHVRADQRFEHEAFIRLQTESNDFMDFVRQHSLIDATARLAGIPWAWQTWARRSLPEPTQLERYVRTDNMIDFPFPRFGPEGTDDAEKNDVARDGVHPGPRANSTFGLATARFVLDRDLLQPAVEAVS